MAGFVNGDFLLPKNTDNNEAIPVNGDFELGDTTGYDVYASTDWGATSEVTVASDYKYSGNFGCLLKCRYTTSYLYGSAFAGIKYSLPVPFNPLLAVSTKCDYKVVYSSAGSTPGNASILNFGMGVNNYSSGILSDIVVGDWINFNKIGSLEYSVNAGHSIRNITILVECQCSSVLDPAVGLDVHIDNLSVIYTDPLPGYWEIGKSDGDVPETSERVEVVRIPIVGENAFCVRIVLYNVPEPS